MLEECRLAQGCLDKVCVVRVKAVKRTSPTSFEVALWSLASCTGNFALNIMRVPGALPNYVQIIESNSITG